LLAFHDAVASGNAAAIRACMHFLPAHARLGDDLAEIYATATYFHRIIEAHFPGQDKGLVLSSFTLTDDMRADARRRVAQATVTVSGNHATLTFPPSTAPGTDPADQEKIAFYNDAGRWKWDWGSEPSPGTRQPASDYPPKWGDGNTEGAMIYLCREGCPEIRRIADDVDSGKLKTYEEVEKAVHDYFNAANTARVTEKILQEPINRGNPATQRE